MWKRTNFLQSQTILKSLEFALARGGFAGNDAQKKTAQSLLKDMRHPRSYGGRQQQIVALLRRGASIEEMIKATQSSRRTIFRYLNDLEEAGMTLVLEDGTYRLK